MIVLDKVSKTYRKSTEPAVSNLSLELENGEIMGFAGLNGAGKSTTIRMVSGILFPSKGTVLVDGHDIVEDKLEASRQVGWVPELPNYELNAKPADLLRYYAGFFGKDENEIESRRTKLLKQFGIWEYRNRKLRNYSQGMKKRFSIVAASQANPNNYLFDETLNGLDPEGVKVVRNYMLNLKKDRKCVFLSSHILSELELVADRIAIIRKGELLRVIDRNELSSLGARIAKITVDNMDSGALKLLEKYGTPEAKGFSVTVRGLGGDSSKYYEMNSDLVRSGYYVSHFEVTGEALEEYFLQMVEDQK